MQPMSHREALLRSCIELTCNDRNKTYGDPAVQHAVHGQLQTIYSENVPVGKYCEGHEAAMGMVLCKIARIICGVAKEDNYADAINYLAIAWECQKRDKQDVKFIGREMHLFRNIRNAPVETAAVHATSFQEALDVMTTAFPGWVSQTEPQKAIFSFPEGFRLFAIKNFGSHWTAVNFDNPQHLRFIDFQ